MPPATPPQVRAAHLKDDLWAIGELGAAAPRVRARLEPETVAAIEQASRIEHLPVALNVEMAEAVHAEAREAGSRAWGTASLLHSLDGFFKPLFVGLTRAIGPSPGLLFKVFPQGWAATYRGCGHFVVTQPGPGLTRLLLRDLPPELRGTPYLTAICGTLESAFRLSKYQGKAILEPRAPDAPEASWLVEWRPTT
jgi:hypothetical protein